MLTLSAVKPVTTDEPTSVFYTGKWVGPQLTAFRQAEIESAFGELVGRNCR
jgi:hypothetical protein